MKTCTKCKISQSLDSFSPDKRARDGRQSRCKTCVAAYQRTRPRNPAKEKFYRIKHCYGLTEEQYNAMLEYQEYCCAACAIPFGNGDRKPCVDHDHSCCDSYKTCGKCVRGIICQKCNTMAGKIEYNIQYLDDLLRYLTFFLMQKNGDIPQDVSFSKIKIERVQQYLNKYSKSNLSEVK